MVVAQCRVLSVWRGGGGNLPWREREGRKKGERKNDIRKGRNITIETKSTLVVRVLVDRIPSWYYTRIKKDKERALDDGEVRTSCCNMCSSGEKEKK